MTSSGHHDIQTRKSQTNQSSQYELVRKLGAGSFGEVFMAKNVVTQTQVAIKLQLKNTESNQLEYEANILYMLAKYYGKIIKRKKQNENLVYGFPKLYALGKFENKDIVVMELLGRDLNYLLGICGGTFSIKTVCMLLIQMMDRLELFHSCGLIHRDIKPNNFVMGIDGAENAHVLYVIDFGLSKSYIDTNEKHIPYRNDKNMIGTIRYASINNHLGIEQSRRDDVDSVLIMCIYFLDGTLPWQGETGINKREHHSNILRVKMATSGNVLCKNVPHEFVKCFQIVKQLAYEAIPPYEEIRLAMWDCMGRNNLDFDYEYDWANKIQKSEPSGNVIKRPLLLSHRSFNTNTLTI